MVRTRQIQVLETCDQESHAEEMRLLEMSLKLAVEMCISVGTVVIQSRNLCAICGTEKTPNR